MNLNELVEDMHYHWAGAAPHDGARGVCDPAPELALIGEIPVGICDVRCWSCLAWMAEDDCPIVLGPDDLIEDPEVRAELIALLRRRVA